MKYFTKSKLLAAAVLSFSMASANAFFVSAGDLWKWVNGSQQEMEIATAYTVGVFDSMQGAFICAPQGVKLEEVKKAAYFTLKGSEQNFDKAADVVIGKTFIGLWPCKKQGEV